MGGEGTRRHQDISSLVFVPRLPSSAEAVSLGIPFSLDRPTPLLGNTLSSFCLSGLAMVGLPAIAKPLTISSGSQQPHGSCHQFPALNSFCSKYLKWFLFPKWTLTDTLLQKRNFSFVFYDLFVFFLWCSLRNQYKITHFIVYLTVS